MKVLLTGGGTGGHTMPLIAVAEALKKHKDINLVVIAEKLRNVEPPVRQTKTYYIKAGKFRRYHGEGFRQWLDPQTVWLNTRDIFRVLRGIVQSWKIIKKERPDVVFIKGGYVSLPVGIAAWLRGVPYVTHDSDAIPGLTNRILAKGATTNLTGFPASYYSYKKSKVMHVGIPVRSEFNTITKSKARKKLGMPLHQKRAVLMGGSLGAAKMNNAFVQIADKLTGLGSILHITGPLEFSRVSNELEQLNLDSKKYATRDFIKQGIAHHLAAADVVVTRAGATSLAELAALKKAIVVIANPLLAEGHQLKNAEIINSYDAAVILDQEQLVRDPMILVAQLDRLLNDSKQRKWLGDNLNKLFKSNAAELISAELLKIGNK